MTLIQLFSMGLFLTGLTSQVYAQEELLVDTSNVSDVEVQLVDKNCWADLFEDNEFDPDDPHVRLLGPFQSATLKDIAGQDWNNEIQSIIVGPNATVRAYKDRDFSGTEVVFVANQRVGSLAELDMSDDIESLKIQCRTE